MKHKANDRAKILVGSFENINEMQLQKLKDKLVDTTSSNSVRKRAIKSIEYWQTTPTKYKINLEKISNVKSQ